MAFLVANLIVPFVLSRIGARWVLIIGSGAFASFVASVAINGSAVLLYVTSILAGFGSAFVWTAGAEVIRQSSSTVNLGGNLGFQSAVYWLGSWLGVASGAFLLESLSLSNLYGIFLAAILFSGLFFWGIKSSEEFTKQDRVDLGYAFNRKMLLLSPAVVGTFFLASLGFSALNLIAVGFGLGFVGLLSTAGQASRILGGGLSGWLSDRLPKEFLLYTLLVFALIGTGLVILVPYASAILSGAVLLGVALAAVYPVTTAFLSKKITTKEYTKATAVFFLYTGIGSVAALLTTLMVDPRTSFLPGILMLVAAFPGVYFFARSKN